MEDEAKWYEDNNDIEKAIEIYYSSGKISKSIELMGQNNMLDKIITTARRKLDHTHRKELLLCVKWIKKLADPVKARSLCIEIYEKCNDYEQLIDLLAAENDWSKAHVIAENTQNVDIINATWLKHANYLAENDEFNAAQKAFVQANRPLEATKVLSKLTRNAIAESRFLDAASYFYKISQNSLKQGSVFEFNENQKLALVYYLYDIVYEYAYNPFLTHEADDATVFYAARWLWLELDSDDNRNYENVNYVAVLYTLAKKAVELKAYKVARLAHEKLRSLKIPKRWRNMIEIDNLKVFSKPFNDADELLIYCPRCESLNQIFPIHWGGVLD